MTERYNVLVSKMLLGNWLHSMAARLRSPADKVIRLTTTTTRPSAKVLRAGFFKPLSLAVVDEQ